jgi:hypothetical protein
VNLVGVFEDDELGVIVETDVEFLFAGGAAIGQ